MPEQKTILIVDDEPDAIAIAEAMLSDIGVQIISETDPEAGLAKAKEAKPDLIIMDVQMPGRTGFDAFGELQKDESTSSIPVVMLTGVAEKTGIGFSGDEMKEFFGEAPAGYLEKPVDPDTLQKTVSKILGL